MKKLLPAAALFLLPLLASAQTLGPIQTLIESIGRLVALAIPILITVALIFFFIGLIQYIRNPELKTGRKIMTAGLVSLFIMVSVWGIIYLAQGALGVNPNAPVQSPGVPTPYNTSQYGGYGAPGGLY